jgi:hypothetical protein
MTEATNIKPVFIVGCPRSGSTWTTFLLSHHPQVATFQHAKVFDYLIGMQRWWRNKTSFSFIVNPSGTATADSGDDDTLRLKQVLPEEALYPLLRPVVDGILGAVASARPGASVVVDKTPENGLLAEFILKVVPDAHFLHIVRDPRAVFCSHRSASRSWAKWEFPTHPVDGGRYWRKDVEAAMRIPQLTDQYLQVRYEDLKDRGPQELARIFDWLDVPADAALCEHAINASSKDKVRGTKELPSGFVRKTPKGGWRDELSPAHARIIEYLTGDLMEQLGYERSQPAAGKPMAITLRDLPVPALSMLDKKLHRGAQLAHWRWVGRKLEWEEP